MASGPVKVGALVVASVAGVVKVWMLSGAASQGSSDSFFETVVADGLPERLGVETWPVSASVERCDALESGCGSVPFEVACVVRFAPGDLSRVMDERRFEQRAAEGSTADITRAKLGAPFQVARRLVLPESERRAREAFVAYLATTSDRLLVIEQGYGALDCGW